LADYFLSILFGYLIGSFPTAYLLVKFKIHKDIRQEGTGNVGTFNTFEVTQSKAVSVAVLIVDILKGVAAVLMTKFLLNGEFWLIASSGVAAIIGHNYPVWLKFKGGRGLAVTAGVMLVFGWIFIVIWILSFAIVYLLSKNLHLGNILAIVATPVIIALIPHEVIRIFIPYYVSPNNFIYLGIVVCSLLLVGHSDIIKLFFSKKKEG